MVCFSPHPFSPRRHGPLKGALPIVGLLGLKDAQNTAYFKKLVLKALVKAFGFT
jgi:hypothetical protein